MKTLQKIIKEEVSKILISEDPSSMNQLDKFDWKQFIENLYSKVDANEYHVEFGRK